MRATKQREDTPVVQMAVGVILFLGSLVFLFEVVRLEETHTFRWIIGPLTSAFGKWWAVVFCIVVGTAVFLRGLKRYRST